MWHAWNIEAAKVLNWHREWLDMLAVVRKQMTSASVDLSKSARLVDLPGSNQSEFGLFNNPIAN